ncbi:MAG TPA: protein kinase, partial [Acidimicrobiales bacterium]|nr:protein kinase [Acidimicrobiales bacterium]
MDVLNDRYELRERLGTGGMAVVWRALDLRLHRTVAVKALSRVLAADPSFLARFEREARHAAALNHPNIVTIFDYGVQEDAAYLVMELVEGESLAKRLRSVQRLDLADTLAVVSGILSGLSEAHRQGIIHRDIKPSNILLGPSGVVKVADFGIARASGDGTQLTDTGVLLGTVGYLSPEQCAGSSATERSDLYSVGCLAFECLIGRPPFTGETPASVMYQHEHAQPKRVSDLLPDVPAAIDAVVARSLEKDPVRRYASATEMRGALLGDPPRSRPPTEVSEVATQTLVRTAALGPQVASKAEAKA